MSLVLAWLTTALAVLVLGTLAAQSAPARHRASMGLALRAASRLLIGLALFVLVLYVTGYFLALVGGFYESLTCKVVTLPACEDPLALPAWLGLPAASVGGVIGVLPLLGIFLAKSLQAAPDAARGPAVAAPPPRDRPGNDHAEGALGWRERLLPAFLAWLGANASLVAILFVELWLAWLRGAAEAADRQVRLALGLDAELPAAYLGVAQWGAVVLALGLSVVVIYLGVAARFGLRMAGLGFADLGAGARLVDLLGALLAVLAEGVRRAWAVAAVVVGRLALKLQSGAARLFVLLVTAFGRLLLKLQSGAARLFVLATTALGRLLLKLQSGLMRLWLFLAVVTGHVVLFLTSLPGRVRRRPPTEVGIALLALAALGAGGAARAQAPTTYVVLLDVSGGEVSRLAAAERQLLSWADPSPQLALLARGDRLVVLPVRAPGELDTVYSALFNATYPGSQLDRFAFFAELRSVLPGAVDDVWGTGLSEALRSAAVYLRDAPPEHARVLIVFGNGEDHSPEPVSGAELRPALEGAVVVRLNAGLDSRERWARLFAEAGAAGQVAFDQAATRLLTVAELEAAIERARAR